MPAKTLMVQGTASSVGKSIMVSALCRIFRQDGFNVAPFKSQNMALNSFVTREGGEIGRAQAVQAEAAGIPPSVDMNPILLKPEADAFSQVIVMGKVWKNLAAGEYYNHTPYLAGVIAKSLDRLRSQFDIIVIEGAGSPAEVNLNDREIVNMKVARMADAPVLLVGDIDRGGVFASIVGTLELLDDIDRDLVRGLIINKFRGDVSLLKPGLDFLEKRSGRPVLGVVPFFKGLRIAQEDSVWLEEQRDPAGTNGLHVAVIGLPHMSNYDDFDPLEDMGCFVHYVTSADQVRSPDLIILPGTKTTVADLNYIRSNGLAQAVRRRALKGTPVIGVCGGFQMLGTRILDPDRVESNEAIVDGLGLLDIETTFAAVKTTSQVKARVLAADGLLRGLAGQEITGYEIHMGLTDNRRSVPVFQVIETPAGQADYSDGAVAAGGNIFGSYIHGLFQNVGFTRSLLDTLRQRRGLAADTTVSFDKEEQYDELARQVRASLDMSQVYRIAGIHPVK
jgi:adenosylcobyric acid synthase